MSKLRTKCSILSAWIFEERIHAFLGYRHAACHDPGEFLFGRFSRGCR